MAALSSDDAELLRLGENAIYRLADAEVVVRIARSADQLKTAATEMCVARWLTSADIPTVRVHEVSGQPLVVEDHPVTFWRAVTGGEPTPTHLDLAHLLRAFHDQGGSPCELPRFDPFAKSQPRIDAAADTVDADARSYLLGRCAELRKRLDELEFALPRGPIHGDAHTGNLLVDRGVVVLSDFETVAVGPREWDLLPMAIASARYGLPEDRYIEFVDAYGFDVRKWDGYPILREIRELGMTTWLMQNVTEDPAISAEFQTRLSSLREADGDRSWTYF